MRPVGRPAAASIAFGLLSAAFLVTQGSCAAATIHITSAPATLSQANTTYILDNDVSASGTAFTITASYVTLDLSGYTVTYNSATGDSVYGVYAAYGKTNIRVTNGRFVQGAGKGYRSRAVYLREVNEVELDHLTISYQGDDNEGITVSGGGSSGSHGAQVHDNVLRPNGTKRTLDHYGTFYAINVGSLGGDVRIYRNDIQGKGFCGIGFGYTTPLTRLEIADNTIKMASPVRDGYAIGLGSGVNAEIGFEIARNLIVQSSGRGIIVAGFNTANDVGPGTGTIHDNYVEVRECANEGYSVGNGIGIQLRYGAHNIQVHNNTVLAHAGLNAAPPQFPTDRGGNCQAYGIKVMGGTYAVNNQIHNNTVIVDTNTTDSTMTACGLYGDFSGDSGSLFHHNTVTSNSILVDLNGSDGGGSNWLFASNTFIKGANPQAFHSIRAGYWTQPSTGNVFLDNSWQGGADGDDVLLCSSGGANYSLSTKWYLHLQVQDTSGNPIVGASVSAVATGGGSDTQTGTTDSGGVTMLTLTQHYRYGVTYPTTTNYTRYSPYAVTISAAGYPTETKTFTMTSSQEATVILDGSAAEPPCISGVTVSDLTQTSATISWTTDRAADSKVEYGLSTSYGTTATDATQVTTHSISLTGLSPGTYHFRVTSTDSGGLRTQGADHTFTILPTGPGSGPSAPVADFAGSPVIGTAPLSVSFADRSFGVPTSWFWSFGDGGMSTAQNPSYTYRALGAYTVALTVANAAGSDTRTKSNYINVTSPSVQASFMAWPTAGSVPLTVQFTDTSTGSPTAWSWRFGDGAGSSEPSLSHTYMSQGVYTVILTVTSGTGGSTSQAARTIMVNFSDIPLGYWAYTEVLGCAKAEVVVGFGDGTFRPTLTVSRDQIAVYLARAVAGGDAHVPDGPATSTYVDVGTSYWAYKYIAYCSAAGIIEGFRNGYYRPTGEVDRGHMAVFIARAIVRPTGDAGLASYVPPTTPTYTDVSPQRPVYTDVPAIYPYVEYLTTQGVVQGYGDGTYRPANTITRDQLAVYVARAFRLWP